MFLPKEWFFFDPSLKDSIKVFNNITNKTGIIFLNKNYLSENKLLKKIQKFISICKKKKIIFFIYSSVYLALKYKAKGVYIPIKDNCINFYSRSYIQKNKKLQIITSCHNKKEIILSKKMNYNFIFISPAYKTNTHKEFVPHSPVNFINLCYNCSSNIFALGGVTRKNVTRLKNKYLKGFGAITYFIKKNSRK